MTLLDKMQRAPSDPRRDVRRQWEQIVARVKGLGDSTREDAMSIRTKDEVVLYLSDPPTPAAKRTDEHYRQRAVDRRREQTRATVLDYRAAQPGNALGRCAYIDDPEVPWSERWLPVTYRR